MHNTAGRRHTCREPDAILRGAQHGIRQLISDGRCMSMRTGSFRRSVGQRKRTARKVASKPFAPAAPHRPRPPTPALLVPATWFSAPPERLRRESLHAAVPPRGGTTPRLPSSPNPPGHRRVRGRSSAPGSSKAPPPAMAPNRRGSAFLADDRLAATAAFLPDRGETSNRALIDFRTSATRNNKGRSRGPCFLP